MSRPRPAPIHAAAPVLARWTPPATGADTLAAAPEWIMWMPAGEHEITATQGGVPVTLRVRVDRATALAAQAAIEEHRRAGAQRPYFDFDHGNSGASAWPEEFAWRDAEAGRPAGVYARVTWSDRGRAAVQGREYRAFSPSFFVSDDDPARVTGAPLNMGGLVNNPAFDRIAPLWAKQAAPKPPMNKTQKLLAAPAARAALQQERATLAADAAQADAVKAKDTEINARLAEARTLQGEVAAEVQAMQAGADREAVEAQARDAELKLLRAEKARLEAAQAERARADARAAVEAAIARGALAPQAKDLHARWQAQIEASPEAAALLAALPGPAALGGSIIQAHAAQIEVTQGDVRAAVQAYGIEPEAAARAALWKNDLRPRVEKGCDLVEQVTAIQRDVSAGKLAIHANTLGTLAGVLVVQRSLDFLKYSFPVLTRISTSFTDEPVKYGQAVTTRIRGALAARSFVPANGYEDDPVTTTDVSVTIDQHRYIQVKFGVEDLAKTMRGLFDEQEEPMHYALGLDMCDALYALITPANFSGETVSTLANFGRVKVIDQATALTLARVPLVGRTLLLTPTFYGKLGSDNTIVSLAAYQQPGIITAGQLPDVHGFRVIEAPNLPATSNLAGFAFRADALAMATRPPNDYTTALPGVPAAGLVQLVTNPDTGITVMLTQWVDHKAGAARGRVAVMYGVAKAQVASANRLVTTATS